MARGRIVVEPEKERELSRRLRASAVSAWERQRVQIILLAAEGHNQEAIGAAVGVTRVTVSQWCRRFAKERPAGHADAPGRARKPTLPVSAIEQVLEKATVPKIRA